MWAIIVAYMLAMHNFYKGEDKTADNIVITIEHNEVQEDGTPKDWTSSINNTMIR